MVSIGYPVEEDMTLEMAMPKLSSINKSLAKKGFSLLVRIVDRCAPDRLLLFGLRFLDHRVPNRLISFAISMVERLAPRRLRSTAIAVADEYVPDEVANSRKICTVLAAVGKYIPDEIIPPESRGRWDKLRTRFHIPRLISSRPR